MNIQYFQKLTLLDYPSKTAATVFTYGCNFRCPFCHNASLVVDRPEEAVDPEEFFAFLAKRKNLLDGVCITGGEPLLQEDIADFIKRIRDMGFLVKLDTNGYLPDRLEKILEKDIVNYIAMDIKNSPEKYPLTAGIKNFDIERINTSINLIRNSGIDFEFRTTAIREYHTMDDFIKIGKWIRGFEKYYIQNFFDSGNTIENGLSGFTPEELGAFKDALSGYLPNTSVRGV